MTAAADRQRQNSAVEGEREDRDQKGHAGQPNSPPPIAESGSGAESASYERPSPSSGSKLARAC